MCRLLQHSVCFCSQVCLAHWADSVAGKLVTWPQVCSYLAALLDPAKPRAWFSACMWSMHQCRAMHRCIRHAISLPPVEQQCIVVFSKHVQCVLQHRADANFQSSVCNGRFLSPGTSCYIQTFAGVYMVGISDLWSSPDHLLLRLAS